MVRFYENVVDVSVAMDEDLNVDPALAGYLSDLLRRLSGAQAPNDLRNDRLRNDTSVFYFRQSMNPPRNGHKTIPVFYMDDKRGFSRISEVISL